MPPRTDTPEVAALRERHGARVQEITNAIASAGVPGDAAHAMAILDVALQWLNGCSLLTTAEQLRNVHLIVDQAAAQYATERSRGRT